MLPTAYIFTCFQSLYLVINPKFFCLFFCSFFFSITELDLCCDPILYKNYFLECMSRVLTIYCAVTKSAFNCPKLNLVLPLWLFLVNLQSKTPVCLFQDSSFLYIQAGLADSFLSVCHTVFACVSAHLRNCAKIHCMIFSVLVSGSNCTSYLLFIKTVSYF